MLGLGFLTLLATIGFVVMVVFTFPRYASEGWDGIGQVWWVPLVDPSAAGAVAGGCGPSPALVGQAQDMLRNRARSC